WSGADDSAAVASERDGCDLVRLLSERNEGRLDAGVPEPGGSVCARRGDRLSVRAERNVRDRVAVAYERHAQRPDRLEDPGDSIPARGRDPLAVGAEDRPNDEVLVARQHTDEISGRVVPDAGALVGARGDNLKVG